jgi:hypothetical protein
MCVYVCICVYVCVHVCVLVYVSLTSTLYIKPYVVYSVYVLTCLLCLYPPESAALRTLEPLGAYDR